MTGSAATIQETKAPPHRWYGRGHDPRRIPVSEQQLSACILWTTSLDPLGYGHVGRTLAHRVAYEQANGPIPAKHDIHHVCENPSCVNPDHLIALTRREHKRLHLRKSHCHRGHEFTPENLYVRPSGQWTCRKCAADRAARYRKVRAS